MSGVAQRMAEGLRPVVGGELPVHLVAWDGSAAGPADAPRVVLNSPRALSRVFWHPGELGAAQAYVAGEIDVEGDLTAALDHVHTVAGERGLAGIRPSPAVAAALLRLIRDVRMPPSAPPSQARVRGRLHTKFRDRLAISHHYDLSNEFYALLLDDSMAYSCAYWRSADPAYTLADAQRDKLQLVLDKLGLVPGMTLLDVGCGWGSLSLYAAERGIRVTGVTIAAEQAAWIREQVQLRGLEETMEVRLQDYREVTGPSGVGQFDAVASIEMGEHVGRRNYPTYAATLRRAVRPGGRVLIQQMSRRGRHPGGGPFIESFIAPDMHMRPVGETVALLEDAGLEVRDVHALREHYVRTVDAWLATFEENFERIVDLVGEEVARVWRLYLVGGRLAFRDRRMGVDQLLAVRPGPHTVAPVRTW
ncbi:cyclopropane-fatty-acyl-phospholipid synthase family protein [Nocardioides sp. AE5]|uniref:cyclopropane-fatty-acyl-phospholipid synthase family protein n=1 Tax=Nocardioides sp. AE5 TaxID=2962573 RepID=UPI002880D822|nr:cyclopropane-fatty-acyl-phospholipid synthase family protein [Nocardioides sp. AE5]MDT0200432.1 cyclopropane-fatty-acyl-phospholipid synthase family protein [Nocardioides sp. AE5]